MKLPVALSLLALTLVGCHGAASNAVSQKTLLLQFAKDQFPGYEVKGSSITGKDVDNDGYVSGTLTLGKPGEPGIRIVGVDIPINSDGTLPDNGSGCRLSREQLHDNKF